MKFALGFVVLSHSEPEQLERLVWALNRAYGQPPIAIHHDFSQSEVDVSRFKGNVWFVKPSLRTQWAHISVVQAALAAIRILYDNCAPTWFTLLSAADYPVMAARQVVEELQHNAFDLYLDYQLAEKNPTPLNENSAGRTGTDRVEWRRRAYDRYVAKTIRYPSLTKRLRPTRRQLTIRSEFLLSRSMPFSPWKCYAGDHWFTGNHKVAEILLSAVWDRRKMFHHFRDRFCPEESIYHTLLCNRPDILICKNNKRYSSWVGQGAHPRVLQMSDLDSILESQSHFARKFSAKQSSQILDRIDEMIAIK